MAGSGNLAPFLDPFEGDSGQGGTEGLVPAPEAGDGADGKFLNAAGGWSVPSGVGGGVTTIGGIDTQTASANALVIVGTTLYGQSASATAPGAVNTTTQDFAGAKTFTSALTVSVTSNYLALGTTNKVTYTSASLTAARTFTTPDANSNSVVGLGSATANNWVQYIGTNGVQNLAQPAFSNLSGTVNLATQVSGILGIANGGTALSTTPSNGQLLIGNATNYTLATLTAGAGISVTNGAGSITISTAATALTDGSVLFAAGGLISQDNANFFYNSSTKALLVTGISTFGAINIQGGASVTSSTHLKLTGVVTGISSMITASDTIGTYNAEALQPTGGASLVAAMHVIKPLIDASLATSATVATSAGLIITAGAKAAGTVTNAVNLSVDAPAYGSSTNAAAYFANATIGYSNINPPTDGLIVKGRITSGSTTPSPFSFFDIFAPTSASYMASFTGTLQANDGFYTLGFYAAPILNPTGGANSAIGFQINPGFRSPTASTITVAKVIEVYGGWSTNIGVITDAYHLYVDGSSGTGTINRGYGLWVAQPTMATLNVCAYFGGGISIGYLATATPTNGAIISGRVAIGANAVSDVSQLTVTATTGANTGLKVNGTVDAVVSNTGYALNLASTLIPTSGAGTVIGSSIKVSFVAPGSQTITYAIGQYIYPTVSSNVGTISNLVNCLIDSGTPGAGTITRAIGLRVEIPSSGSSNICGSFAGGIAVGYDLIGLPVPPSLGAIIAGQTVIGSSTPSGTAILTLVPTGRFGLSIQGTQTTTDGSNQHGTLYQTTFSPASSTTTVNGMSMWPTFSPGTSVTITTANAISIVPVKSGVGTVTNLNSLYVAAPTGGATSNIAILADNLSIGYTVTPPTNGAIISGRVAIGYNAATYYLEVNGTSTNDGVRIKGASTNLQMILNNTSGASGSRSFALTNNSGFTALLVQKLSDADAFSATIMGMFSNSGISVGSTYSTLTPAANGAIFEGVVGIATNAPNTQSSLTVAPGARYNILINGTYNPVMSSFSAYDALDVLPNYSPSGAGTDFSSYFRAVNSQPNFAAPSTKTMTGALCCYYAGPTLTGNAGTLGQVSGFYYDGGAALTGTVSSSYGMYLNAPNAGTVKVALYSANAALGFTGVTPPSNGLIVAGSTVLGGTSLFYTNQQLLTIVGGTGNCAVGTQIAGTTVSTVGLAFGSTEQALMLINGGVKCPASTTSNGIFSGIQTYLTVDVSNANAVIVNAATIAIGTGTVSSLGSGSSVTNGYGIYISNPGFGTNKIALFSANAAIGYAGITPPTNGLVVAGHVGIGTSSPSATSTVSIAKAVGDGSAIYISNTTTLTASLYEYFSQGNLAPAGGASQCSFILLNGAIAAPSAQTITAASGIFVYVNWSTNVGTITTAYNALIGAGTAGAGTITKAIGLFVEIPTCGSTNICAEFTGVVQFDANATGSGTALLGSNCPASTVSAPYTWLTFRSSDGSTVRVPAWK